MAGLLSKIKQSSNSTANKRKATATTTNSLKQSSENSIVLSKTWTYGGLFILSLLIVLVTMAVSIQQTKQNAAHREISNRIQIHSQRLAKASQQTMSGNVIAFEQLAQSQEKLNSYMSILFQGGVYHNTHLSPISEGPPATHLEIYRNNWLAENKKVVQILNNKDTLIKLGNIVKKINAANNQLLRLIDRLTARMEQIGGLPNEITAGEAIKVLALSLTKSIYTILPGESPVSEIAAQLTTDSKKLSVIINALNRGSHELQISPLTDDDAATILKQIKTIYSEIENDILILQKQIPEIITTKFSVQWLFKNSEVMLQLAEELETAIQDRERSIMNRLHAAIYGSATISILMLFLFVRSLTSSIKGQLLTTKKEINQTQKAILRLLDDLGRLADGDLTVRTLVTEDVTGAIADSINYTIEELNQIVEEVNQASTQVATAATHAQQVSTKLLNAAQLQSQKIEESTIAVLGMAESISSVSETASESAKVAKKSLENAEKGTIAVRASIAGMNEIRTYIQETSKRIKRLGESSQEIGEIIALISDITEQTNVLALNAAIQATAAGEAGRGFTVIAQEVQRLAERSAAATKQIGILVKTIQGDTKDTIAAMEKSTSGVAEGAKRSDIAGQALEEIEEVSKHLAQLVTGIFDNTQAQAQVADKVVQNMEEILSITRQTTDGTKQTAISVKKINGFAAELKASVSNFKV
ncbi:MAG: methyl-accepting chemotaxis protein [Nitrosomonas sp.]|nr:methyl-accepting chemotaxis protein [Nitrosomonas sp.]